jgi:CPA1 family monovalent cation:H+ antiporter
LGESSVIVFCHVLRLGLRETSQNIVAVWLPSVIAILFVILGRAVAVYPLCLLFARSDLRVNLRHQHALLWGGLRGALALALALGLPVELPGRAEIITVSFAVVAFSVIAQGLTMPPLLRVIGEIPPVHQNEEVRTRMTRGD